MRYYWGLDICRAIAVLLVFSVHYLSLFYPSVSATGWQGVVLRLGHSGVDLFFVLSGYLLYDAFLKKPEQSRSTFLQNRAWRIFPAYWVALSAYALAMLMFGTELSYGWLDWTLNAFQNLLLLSPLLDDAPWMVVSWTLTFEWGWYLLLPLLFSAQFHRMSQPWRAALLMAGLLFFSIHFGTDGGPEQISLFFAGALLAEYQKDICRTPSVIRALLCIPVIAVAIALYNEALWVSVVLSGLGWALCLSLALSTATTAGRRWGPAIFLGKISYSFYLWHSLALHATLRLLGENTSWVLNLAAGLLLSILLATFSYQWVEQPSLSLRKRRTQNRFK